MIADDPRATAMAKLDRMGTETFCDHVIDGDSYRDIAGRLEIGVSAIVRWLALDAERSARVKEARITASQTYDDEALSVLKDKSMDPARGREIASHLRWRAKMVNPREYGDKVQVDQTTTIVNLSDEEITRRRAQLTAELHKQGIPVSFPLLQDGGE